MCTTIQHGNEGVCLPAGLFALTPMRICYVRMAMSFGAYRCDGRKQERSSAELLHTTLNIVQNDLDAEKEQLQSQPTPKTVTHSPCEVPFFKPNRKKTSL